MDWFRNGRNQQVLAIENDASRFGFDRIETDSQSAARSVELLKGIRAECETDVQILKVITDHASEFVTTRKEDRPCLNHEFERYLHEYNIEHSLCKVGRPQSNGKLERFLKTYEKPRWRFDTLDEFLYFYDEGRPHMSLLWDELETPA